MFPRIMHSGRESEPRKNTGDASFCQAVLGRFRSSRTILRHKGGSIPELEVLCSIDGTGATLHIVCPDGVTRLGGAEFKQCEGWHIAHRSERRKEASVALSGSALRERRAQASTARCHLSHCWSVSSKPELCQSQSMRKVAPHTRWRCERFAFITTGTGTIRLRPSDYAVIVCPCRRHGQTKKWPPRRAAEGELIAMKEFTFQPPRPGFRVWPPRERSRPRSSRGRDCPAPHAAPFRPRGPDR